MCVTLERYGITTPIEVAHFLTQVLAASRCLHYVEESTCGSEYEGRLDLGNVEAGDGQTFRGRGLLPLVGRTYYLLYSRHAERRFDLWPELVAEDEYAADVAGWLWTIHGCKRAARRDDLRDVTERLYGALVTRRMDLSERYDLLARVKDVLGVLG